MAKKPISEVSAQIDADFLAEHANLEDEYYETVWDDTGERRVIREGKDEGEFRPLHADLWKRHVAALETAGVSVPQSQPAPRRDLAAEVDAIKERLEGAGI